MENTTAGGVGQLPGVVELAKRTWEVFKNHWKNLGRLESSHILEYAFKETKISKKF
ncbi:MAG: hypothetical protein AAB691_00400 [Patescibacteria group bacterium]